ncbi:hypothetical protein DEAC_c12940 [Desulfosporosinus acididurans]|uniref:DUF1868 domain-containing protein n=1 Tax=Desulfosporosinus acididurans TaxID=476652 RepID=A0A0J1FUF7_9FIRM|nr:hypothetical protein [Desulfosporosinus acididurans]KLU66628.1 hypothetical protein DEAC_c12940 [Desulfosporosinus acididurans]
MEMNYTEYLEYVEMVLAEKAIREYARQMKTLGKFKESTEGLWEPVPYSGYTLITPTYLDDEENVDSYRFLSDIREELFWNIPFPGIVWAPTIALHMTIGRLISGDVFKQRIRDSREDEFLLACHQMFSHMSSTGSLSYEIKGLSVFPQGVIAAIVSPLNEGDYSGLQAVRDYLYDDNNLKQLGVERKRRFQGHISLFYLEEELSGKERRIMADAVSETNRRFFNAPLPFRIKQAEVRKFDNFSEFNRHDHWPVFRL